MSVFRLRNGKRFIRNLPNNVRTQDVLYFDRITQFDCPPLHIYRFSLVNLLPDSTLFKYLFPLEISFPFFRKRLKHHNWKGILAIRFQYRKIRLKPNGPYLIIHDQWTHNYYHWITQALPRLLLAQQFDKPFTLLLPQDHQSEFHKQSLQLLNINTWYTLDRNLKYYVVPDAWYPTHDIQIGDYNDDLIIDLRKKMAVKNCKPPSRKIFISRVARDKRRIINEREVLQLFVSFGFEILEFERLPFRDQISLASEAKVLAGVHGAGLTNMIFMPMHSVVIELTTRINSENYYYYTLSNALAHRYYYQVCTPDADDEVQDANLEVDLVKLREILTSISA